MLWPGVPCVYYGDEIGMVGGPDPDNRHGMNWDEDGWDHDLRRWYQDLIRRRRQDDVLARGGVAVLQARGDVFCFARVLADAVRVVALHRGRTATTVSLDLAWLAPAATGARDQLDRGHAPVIDGTLTLDLEPGAVRLLHLEGPS